MVFFFEEDDCCPLPAGFGEVEVDRLDDSPPSSPDDESVEARDEDGGGGIAGATLLALAGRTLPLATCCRSGCADGRLAIAI